MTGPERVATVIRQACIVTMDPAVGLLERADLHFDAEGAIVAVGAGLAVPEGTREVNGADAVVLPGFVDSHRHVWQTALRGLATDLTVPEYRSLIRGQFAPRYRPEDVYASTLLGDLEALNGGVTALADLANITNTPEHTDAAVRAHLESGMRVVFGHGTPSDADHEAWYSSSARRHPQDVRRIAKILADNRDGLVGLGMLVRPPYLVRPEVLHDDIALARDVGAHVFVDGGVGGGCWGGRRWGEEGRRPVHDLAAAGALGPGLTIVHCNNLPDDELALIGRSGTAVSISPDAEMNCGHGVPATQRLLRHGTRPGLSIDIVVQVGGDMFGAMRSTIAVARGTTATWAYETDTALPSWELRAADVLGFATTDGAGAAGLGGVVGMLAPGYRADVVLLRSDPFNLEPLNDPVGSVVMAAHPGNVEAVWVDGRCVKEGGRLTVDAAGVVAAARRARDHLVGDPAQVRGHGRGDRSWAWT